MTNTQYKIRNTRYETRATCDEIPLYICREPSTNQPLFTQNKPNFQKPKMNVSIFLQRAYENKSNCTLGENKPNQTQFPCP